MTSKKGYEEKFNEILGSDIEWSRLKKDDLKKLDGFVDVAMEKIKNLEEKIGFTAQGRPVLRVLNLAERWFKKSKGPVAKIFRKVYKEGIDSIEEKRD